jgi:hypothetical protein
MLRHNTSFLMAIVLLSVTFAASGSPGSGSGRQKESCDQCMTRQKQICADNESACELRAKAASMRSSCGGNEDCAKAAKETLDQEILACGQEEEACNSRATTKCPQCKSDAEPEPCDTCVSRQERICGYREAACKALARAEYYVGRDRCRPEDKRCLTLTKQAYDDSAMACVLGAQACGLGATDGCSRCRFVEPHRRPAKRR